jgi:hypothetical protein
MYSFDKNIQLKRGILMKEESGFPLNQCNIGENQWLYFLTLY